MREGIGDTGVGDGSGFRFYQSDKNCESCDIPLCLRVFCFGLGARERGTALPDRIRFDLQKILKTVYRGTT